MLEIIGIIFFTRHLAQMARMKGQSGWIAAIGPLFWIGGEFGGACVGAGLGIESLVLYLFALVGAAVGAAAAYGIVAAVPTKEGFDPLEMENPFSAPGRTSACPECGSMQTERIGNVVVCNACDAQSPV